MPIRRTHNLRMPGPRPCVRFKSRGAENSNNGRVACVVKMENNAPDECGATRSRSGGKT